MWMKTSNARIVMGGKLEQFCRDIDLEAFREAYNHGCGENISSEEWESLFTEAEPEELIGLSNDQFFMQDRVVFLDDDGYGPLCVWIDEVTDWNGNLLCYAHIGQHSVASYEYAEAQKPFEDYQDLKEELEGRGYVLNVLPELPKLKRFKITSESFPMAIVYAENRHDATANFVRSFGERVLDLWN